MATKSHILSRGPPTACHYCVQTLTIEHILQECTVLQQSRDEYYTVDSLRTLFETIPEACIIEFLREAGFYYLIWMARYPTQLFIKSVTNWRHSQVELIPTTEHHHWNSFIERKQLWDNPTCEGRLICPEGRVSSLNKCNRIKHACCMVDSIYVLILVLICNNNMVVYCNDSADWFYVHNTMSSYFGPLYIWSLQ